MARPQAQPHGLELQDRSGRRLHAHRRCGIQLPGRSRMTAAFRTAATSTRQRMARGFAGEGSGPRLVAVGSPVTSARAVSTSARCPPTARRRAPWRATSAPIAVSEHRDHRQRHQHLDQGEAGARRGASERVERDNLDASGEPIDADFVAGAEPASARSRRRTTCRKRRNDGRARPRADCSAPRASRRSARRPAADAPVARARAHRARRRVDFGRDLQRDCGSPRCGRP